MVTYSISKTNANIGETITLSRSENVQAVTVTFWFIDLQPSDYGFPVGTPLSSTKCLANIGKLFATQSALSMTVTIEDNHTVAHTLTPITVSAPSTQYISSVYTTPLYQLQGTSNISVDIGEPVEVNFNRNIYNQLKFLVNRWTRRKEDKSNKVTSWSSTTNDTRYPTEKLVKDSLDTKLDKLQRTVTTFTPQDYSIGDGTWTNGMSVTFNLVGNASILELANMLSENGNVVDFVLTLNRGSCTIKDRAGDTSIWSGTANGDKVRIQVTRDGQYCTIRALDSVGVELYSENFPLNDTGLSLIANSTDTKIDFGSKQWYHTVSFIDMIYPIGSIYMGMNSLNPSLFIGGEWEAIEDCFLFGVGTKHSYGRATGGSETVTLTSAQSGVPAHSHKYDDYNTTYTLKTTNRKPGTSTAVAYGTSLTAGGGATERTSSNNTTANASQAHENMPPYMTVYMWERVG